MLLVIDSGNSNVVFAIYDGENFCGSWRISSNPYRTAEEYLVWLARLMEEKGWRIGQIRDVVLANVVPIAQPAFLSLCQESLSCDPLVIEVTDQHSDPGIDFGFQIRVDNPCEVGADRLANVAAMNDDSRLPAIVIDFGTATTFDVIDSSGNYCGGAIAPGIHLSVSALHQAAARLPLVGVDKPRKAIGTSTMEAMQSGIYWGYVGMIDGLIQRLTDELGKTDPHLVATGGLADIFQNSIHSRIDIEPDLTLKGLVHLYSRNRQG